MSPGRRLPEARGGIGRRAVLGLLPAAASPLAEHREVFGRALNWRAAGGGAGGPVANFSRPVCELQEKAARLNSWLWSEVSYGRISTYDCVGAGSAERISPTNRVRKNFATGPFAARTAIQHRSGGVDVAPNA